MKTEPVIPASIDFDADGTPRSPRFGDVYHPHEGWLEQARGVFLAGNGLPARWQRRESFTVMETGFGLGLNFLATWDAWRSDPKRCTHLHYVALDKHPPTRADLQRALAAVPWPVLAQELVEHWPPLTPNLHKLSLDGGRVRLLLGFGDAATLAREVVARVDAFHLDGFAPARNPAMWTPALFEALARLAVPGATAATWSAARTVRDGLAAVGFDVRAAAGPGRKRDVTHAVFAPRFVPPAPPGRVMAARAPSDALVVGAGLAGAACARALASHGVRVTVLDEHARPAQAASGNDAGLFHGTLGVDDTPHARWHRAASFHAARWLIECDDAGCADGLLRLESGLDIAAMRALVDAQALPPEYVQALDTAQASQLAGHALPSPAWGFVHGGWARPASLVQAALRGEGVSFVGGSRVERMNQLPDGRWQALDARSRMLAEADVAVIAGAHDALRLAGLPASWLSRVRGQVSAFAAPAGLAPLRLPVASGRYALTLPDGRWLVGATQQRDDDDPAVRASDHADNLAGAASLIGDVLAGVDARTLQGRVGWRASTHDRLPLAGGVPDLSAPQPARQDAPRLLPRRANLYLLAGLGSRGLTSAALAGERIAAQCVGAPWPVEADLAEALDPARCALRDRQGSRRA